MSCPDSLLSFTWGFLLAPYPEAAGRPDRGRRPDRVCNPLLTQRNMQGGLKAL